MCVKYLLSGENPSLPTTGFIKKEAPGLIYAPFLFVVTVLSTGQNGIHEDSDFLSTGKFDRFKQVPCTLMRTFPALENVHMSFHIPFLRFQIVLFLISDTAF